MLWKCHQAKGHYKRDCFMNPLLYAQTHNHAYTRNHPHAHTHTMKMAMRGMPTWGQTLWATQGTEVRQWRERNGEVQAERVLSVCLFSMCSPNVSLSTAVLIPEALHDSALETHFIYTNLSIFAFTLSHTQAYTFSVKELSIARIQKTHSQEHKCHQLFSSISYFNMKSNTNSSSNSSQTMCHFYKSVLRHLFILNRIQKKPSYSITESMSILSIWNCHKLCFEKLFQTQTH